MIPKISRGLVARILFLSVASIQPAWAQMARETSRPEGRDAHARSAPTVQAVARTAPVWQQTRSASEAFGDFALGARRGRRLPPASRQRLRHRGQLLDRPVAGEVGRSEADHPRAR